MKGKLKYKIVKWEAKVTKCPHCECFCDITATSDISVHCVMTYIYTKMMNHIRTCSSISTMNPKPKVKKIAKVSVMTESKHPTLGTYLEWKKHKLSI